LAELLQRTCQQLKGQGEVAPVTVFADVAHSIRQERTSHAVLALAKGESSKRQDSPADEPAITERGKAPHALLQQRACSQPVATVRQEHAKCELRNSEPPAISLRVVVRQVVLSDP